MKIGVRETTEEHKHLGDWEAQVEGLPQARCYGKTIYEAVGKLVFAFGKEHGVELNKDVQDQRHKAS